MNLELFDYYINDVPGLKWSDRVEPSILLVGDGSLQLTAQEKPVPWYDMI